MPAQVALLYCVSRGFLSPVDGLPALVRFKKEFPEFLAQRDPTFAQCLTHSGELDDALRAELEEAYAIWKQEAGL